MSLDIWLSIKVDTGGEEPYQVELFHANYTHNVTPMWKKAGVYEVLYESHGVEAGAILFTLRLGLLDMLDKPAKYRKLNPPNGWGDYDSALEFLQELKDACVKHPKAIIGIWA